MKAHQSDKDAEEGRVQLSDLQGNRLVDPASNNGTRAHVPFEASEEWKQWGTVLRLPAPELEFVEVVTVEETNVLAAPFVVGPHQRVVEHATYAICMDCDRHVGVHTGRKTLTTMRCRVGPSGP
eukprot:6465582-Amphidinium_carterae.1